LNTKKSSYIDKNVYLVNVRYTKMMNKTKELYFRCLEEGKSVEYFRSEVSKIWDNVDHRFMQKQIEKLRKMVNESNVDQAINLGRFDKEYLETLLWVMDSEYFKLTPESEFIKFEQRYKNIVVTNYDVARNYINESNKEYYLQRKIKNYDNEMSKIITYFSKDGLPLRQVMLSTYLSMIHNVDLTRSAWNQTMSDSEKLGTEMFIIPYHPFSCLKCYEWQNRPLSKEMVENIIGVKAVEQQGNILHPNCKCTLDIYWSPLQISRETVYEGIVEAQYKIRQKVNSLTLQRSRLRTDYKIYKMLGDEGKADEVRTKINKINKSIREEVDKLPTNSLKKQVKAINR